jgi:catechol 2,3-dioxygenase-like lactoylglutathione lyase family enzyme
MRVTQIDHVELEVPDRYAAASWYRTVLGFEICQEYESWARGTYGPLMISTDGGETKLALFAGQPQGQERPIGIRRIAFRIGGDDFLRLIEELDALKGSDAVKRSEITDHGKSFSVYFSDPDGNRLEVTTYDYDVVRGKVAPGGEPL